MSEDKCENVKTELKNGGRSFLSLVWMLQSQSNMIFCTLNDHNQDTRSPVAVEGVKRPYRTEQVSKTFQSTTRLQAAYQLY